MSSFLEPAGTQRLALIDLLDRLLAGGVVLVGEITISVADVELVQISLRALIASMDGCHDGQS
ncbi:MAG: gas vesicle protein [Pseudonocardiaceae bacterium]